MTDREIIMHNLSNAIRESGMTAKELSLLSGISYDTIRNYINEKSMPMFKNLVAITNVLNLKPENIISNLVDK